MSDQTSESKKHSPQSILLLVITALNLCLAALLVTVFLQYRSLKRETTVQESPADVSADDTSSTSEDANAPVQNNVSEMDMALYQAQCREIPYEEFARDSEAMKRQYFTFTGVIKQAMEGSYRLGVKNGSSYSDIVYLDYEIPAGAERVLEGDFVTVWGVSEGLYTYTTVSDTEITVPRLDVGYLVRLTDEEIEALDRIEYMTAEVSETLETEEAQITLNKVLMRPATADDVRDGEAYANKVMLFFLLDVMNISDEEQYFSNYDFTPYIDSYLTYSTYNYSENPEGYESLGEDIAPGHGMHGYLTLIADENWQTLELKPDDAEGTFLIARKDFT